MYSEKEGNQHKTLSKLQYSEIQKYFHDLLKNNGVGSMTVIGEMIYPEKAKTLIK